MHTYGVSSCVFFKVYYVCIWLMCFNLVLEFSLTWLEITDLYLAVKPKTKQPVHITIRRVVRVCVCTWLRVASFHAVVHALVARVRESPCKLWSYLKHSVASLCYVLVRRLLCEHVVWGIVRHRGVLFTANLRPVVDSSRRNSLSLSPTVNRPRPRRVMQI